MKPCLHSSLVSRRDPLRSVAARLVSILLTATTLLPACSGPGPELPTDSTEPISLQPLTDALPAPPARAHGISLADFDDDGIADVTLAAVSGLRIYKGLGDFTFEDITEQLLAGASPAPDLEHSYAPIWVDIDDDGDLDLFVSRRVLPQDSGPGIDALRSPLLLRQDEDGLTDISASSGLDSRGSWEGASFADLSGDGLLDLVIAGGVDASSETNAALGYTGSLGGTWRNLGDGSFQKMSGEQACSGPEDSESWGVIALDVDRDGDQDIIEANDFRPATFCRNRGDGSFEPADDLVPDLGSPMGLAAGDLTGDGCIDVYATNFENPDNVLSFQNDSGFTDHYLAMVADGSDPSPGASGYGVSLHDVDLDGDQDVLWVSSYESGVATAGVSPGRLALARRGDSPNGPRLVYASAGQDAILHGSYHGFGLAHGDLDGDGDLDFGISIDDAPRDEHEQLIVVPDEFVTRSLLLRNDTERDGREWIAIELRQDAPNRRAIGAIVSVRVQGRTTSRVLTAGSSFLSSHALPLHFGLGRDTQPEFVHVRWPGGGEQFFTDLNPGLNRITRSGESCVPAGSCEGFTAPCETP